MAWNTDVSADGKPHSLWKQGRALASQPESVTKTNIAENRIHRSGVNARRQKPLSAQPPSESEQKAYTQQAHLTPKNHNFSNTSDTSTLPQCHIFRPRSI